LPHGNIIYCRALCVLHPEKTSRGEDAPELSLLLANISNYLFKDNYCFPVISSAKLFQESISSMKGKVPSSISQRGISETAL
jgi:hypothetical protein